MNQTPAVAESMDQHFGRTEKERNRKQKGGKQKERLVFNPGRDVPMYLLLLPAVLLLFVFNYVPIYGVIIAFKDYSPYKGVLASPWVGLKYFQYFLGDPTFWQVMRNTIVINVYNLIWGFPAPIIFALLLNEVTRVWWKKTIQTVSYLPYFISWVVAAGLVTSLLSPTTGLVNQILSSVFHIQPIYFLTKKEYFRSIVIMADIWKGLGMSAVYYIASITSIDQEQYEAARIDGAGRWKQTWYITLPGIANIIAVLLILNIGSMVTIGFENIFLLYNPVVYDVADVISTYTYRLGIEGAQFSLTTAIGLTQSVVNFALVYSANKISRKVAGWSLW